MAAPETIGDWVRALDRRFREAGLATPSLDARWLVEAATGRSAERLILEADRPVDQGVATQLAAFAERRLAQEPVSRIIGERGFYGRMFRISPAVLDPRPETELVVTHGLRRAAAEAAGRPPDRPVTVLDVGTGSGAIIVSMLAEDVRLRGIGIDVSPEALAIARHNAQAHGVAGRLDLVACGADAIGTLAFDLVVANPPYIPSADIPALEPDVSLHDPRLALDGGNDGLDVFRAMFGALGAARYAGGVVTEVGAGQAADVIALARVLWSHTATMRVEVAADYAGHQRCVVFEPQA